VTVPPFHWWRTVFFLIPIISLSTIVFGTVSLLAALIDRRGYASHWCARAWAWTILKTTGVSLRRHGQAPRSDVSYVVASNHQSLYDIPVLFCALPFQMRIIAKSSLGSFPFLGWHLRLAGHLLVDREKPGASILKKMQRMVRQGASLMIFPEGTRSRDGQVGRFKGGVFLLAIDSSLPVVPITLNGTRGIMQKGGLMARPGIVDFTIHEPIATTGMTRDDARALAQRVRDVVAAPIGVE
jgi:1-acyl-sn-glycerol-3-phosphate acyltransferase